MTSTVVDVKKKLAVVLSTSIIVALYIVYLASYTDIDTQGWLGLGTANNDSQLINGKYLYVTVKLKARTGNIMFMYASLLGIARRGGRIPVFPPGSLLDAAFDLTHAHHLTLGNVSHFAEAHYAMEDPRFSRLPLKNVSINGYLQSYKYFKDVQDELRKEFVFHSDILSQARAIVNATAESFPGRMIVGVHQRRADFSYDRNLKLGYTAAPVSYFVKAFQYYRKLAKREGRQVCFLVISDDLEWCAKKLNFTDVEVSPPASLQVHMAVVSQTENAIISSGTFSYWSGWLTGGKVVYYAGYPKPGTWAAKDFSKEDYYPPDWVGLGA